MVLSLALATALSLALGTYLLLFQIAILLAFLAACLLFQKSPLWISPKQGVWLVSTGSSGAPDSLWIASQNHKFSRNLSEHGLESSPIGPSIFRGPPSEGRSFSLGLVAAAIVWLILIQLLGVAQFRVLVGGGESASLLIDSRMVAVVEAANSEDPRSGRALSVLGGRRHIQLITAAGQTVAEGEMTIWPGRTYIVGYLPADRCLFWEEQGYGEVGPLHTLVPEESSGPIWEFNRRIDSWFIPLSGEEGEGTLGLATSGGLRTALRLLPCSKKASGRTENGRRAVD